MLASKDDIFTRCGTFVYTVKIDSAKGGTYEKAFTITLDSETDPKSGKVDVRTDDQDFAIDTSKYDAAVKADKVS